MSVCEIAIVAASTLVNAPVHATTSIASLVSSGKMRAMRYTPAATIVAGWMRALTGVGPSIASGNQTCSGNCADLPIAPQKISRPAIVIAVLLETRPKPNKVESKFAISAVKRLPGLANAVTSCVAIAEKLTEPTAPKKNRIPSMKPKSPRRFVRNEEHTSELQSRQYLVCRLLL